MNPNQSTMWWPYLLIEYDMKILRLIIPKICPVAPITALWIIRVTTQQRECTDSGCLWGPWHIRRELAGGKHGSEQDEPPPAPISDKGILRYEHPTSGVSGSLLMLLDHTGGGSEQGLRNPRDKLARRLPLCCQRRRKARFQRLALGPPNAKFLHNFLQQ